MVVTCFVQFRILLFLWQTQKLKNKFFWVLREKETFACAIFTKICYVACRINRASKLIYLRACLHEHDRAGLTDKPATAQFPSFIGINFHFRGSFRLSCTPIRKVLLGHWDTFWILKIYSKLSWVLHLK